LNPLPVAMFAGSPGRSRSWRAGRLVWYRSNMSSNTTHDLPREPWRLSGDLDARQLPGIDPIVLGQAGLQALALAGTAILARYARIDEGTDGMYELEARVPHPDRGILLRALGAFAEPTTDGHHAAEGHDPAEGCDPAEGQDASGRAAPADPAGARRRADALLAMCLRARTVLARQGRPGSSMVLTGVPRGERASG
jgi:hypothetical protein